MPMMVNRIFAGNRPTTAEAFMPSRNTPMMYAKVMEMRPMASNLLPTTMEMTIAIRNRTRTTDGDIQNSSFSLL